MLPRALLAGGYCLWLLVAYPDVAMVVAASAVIPGVMRLSRSPPASHRAPRPVTASFQAKRLLQNRGSALLEADRAEV